MRNFLLYSLFLIAVAASAQEKDKHLPIGNNAFDAKKYADAEAEYRISQSKTTKNAAAAYNLGNSIYMQNQAAESKSAFRKAIENTNDRRQKHQAFHNLGNALMKEKDYTQAVEAYKNALRNNPEDEQTRYNYALAKKMLKDNPPKKDDKKDDKKEDKKDKKDDKNKDKDKKDEKNKDQDKKDGDKDKKNQGKDKPEEKPQPKPGGISKERIQNLMDAVNNEEKKVQDKVNAKKVKGKPVQTEKDW